MADIWLGLLTYCEDNGAVELYVTRNPGAAFGGDRWTYTVFPDSPGVTVNDIPESYVKAVEAREWATLSPHALWESPSVSTLEDVMRWAAEMLFRTGLPHAFFRPLFSAPGNFDHVFRQECETFWMDFNGSVLQDPGVVARRESVDTFLASLPP